MFLLLTFNGGMCDENLILFMKPPDVRKTLGSSHSEEFFNMNVSERQANL